MDDLRIQEDDLSGEPTRALLREHLERMRQISPEESCHALDLSGLEGAAVTVWSAWMSGEIAGTGALTMLDAHNAELKSMRVADAFLGRGVGRAMLSHLISEAQARGVGRLWLETGSTAEFVPALRLYESAGFERCAPFGSYREDPLSVFMTRLL
ncbi:GNAT family N-acetyltransferase [Microbacterium sediminicola]|uniref:GNAT family N-acetyltransferase n=1 Tax=Microbacterium sediminicola TaxID=415210 RepID=A0ABN2I4L4_9MICO